MMSTQNHAQPLGEYRLISELTRYIVTKAFLLELLVSKFGERTEFGISVSVLFESAAAIATFLADGRSNTYTKNRRCIYSAPRELTASEVQ